MDATEMNDSAKFHPLINPPHPTRREERLQLFVTKRGDHRYYEQIGNSNGTTAWRENRPCSDEELAQIKAMYEARRLVRQYGQANNYLVLLAQHDG